jgi:hypothetical protein
MSEREGPKTTAEKQAVKMMADVYLSYPDFGAYLENGGVTTILNIRKAKTGQGLKGAELAITYEELRKSELDQLQQSRLEDANKKFPQKITAQINTIAEALVILKVQTQGDFNAKLSDIKYAQGLKSGAPEPVKVAS